MSRKLKKIFIFLIFIVIIVAAYFYIQSKFSSQPRSMPQSEGTPVQVGVVTTQDVPVIVNALGTVTANKTVTVTSRITGNLQSVYFKEGQYVHQGDSLAQIDVKPSQATLEQYEGTLSQNQAQLKNARLTLERYQRLYEKDSISKQDLDTQTATAAQYEGAIKSVQGQIQAAKLNIGYGRIVAPISGYIGLRKVDIGNAVSADSTAIAVITQTRPITVVFSIPQSEIADIVKPLREGKPLVVHAYDQSGKTQLAEGKVAVISNEIDSSTGTISLKAVFENQSDELFPNQFVNVQLTTKTLSHALVVPSAAVQLSDAGKYVFTVNNHSTVKKVMVKTGPETNDGKVTILEGVQNGEQVVTTGVDSLGNGAKVKVVTPEKVDTRILDNAPAPRHHGPR